MRSLKQLAGVGAALALCLSPAMAAAATSSASQPVNPLTAISVFGSPASAQIVCAEVVGAAATAAAAQGQTGCVLPATDVAPPPPPLVTEAPIPMSSGWDTGTFLLAGLGALFLAAGLIALFKDDHDNNNVAISPA